MTDKPLVSVVLASFNGARFIYRQIQSILAQSNRHFELIITDNLSTDGTWDVVKDVAARDDRVRIFRNEKLGVIENFEFGVTQARGELVCFSDQDDVWNIDKIQVLLDSIGEKLAIHSDARIINAEGEVLEASYMRTYKARYQDLLEPMDHLLNNNVTGCTLMARADFLRSIIPFPRSRIYLHDWWIALRAAERRGLAYVDAALVDYRQHEHNFVGVGRPGSAINVSSLVRKLDSTKKLHLEYRAMLLSSQHWGTDRNFLENSRALLSMYKTLKSMWPFPAIMLFFANRRTYRLSASKSAYALFVLMFW